MYRYIILLTLVTFVYQHSLVTVQAAEPVTNSLLTAQRLYAEGNYASAQQAFAAVLTDTTATTDTQRVALHWRGRSELMAGNPAAAIMTLENFLLQYPHDDLQRATQFNLGLAYQQITQIPPALKAYRASLIADDPINVYIYEQIGDALLTTAAYTDTIATYQAGLDSTNEVNLRLNLRRKLGDTEIMRHNPMGAITHYQAISSSTKSSDYHAKMLKLMGDAYIAAGNATLGQAKYIEAVNQYPMEADSYLALLALVEAKVTVDDFQRGIVDYHAEAYQPAVEAFTRYLALPEPPQKADALWHLGLSYQGLGQYANARENFQKLIDSYPTHLRWGQAHLEIGQMLGWLGRVDEATQYYRQFAAKKPKPAEGSEALWQAGLLEYNEDLFEAAYTNLRQLPHTYPTSDYADEALYWAGRAAFKLKKYQEAADTWGELVKKYPKSDLLTFGSYWQAKALAQLGREAEAKPIWQSIVDKPLDYYALRARDALAGQQPHSVPIALPSAEQLATEQAEAETWLRQWAKISETISLTLPSAKLQQDLAFQRGMALLELGWRDKALLEFETVRLNWWNSPLELYQLALYFQQQNMGRLSIMTAARVNFLSPTASIDEAPMFIQRLFYPIYFPELFFAEATAQGIDPALAISLIRQESLFEPSAESWVGARGLMQVMPATGDYIAQQLKFANYQGDQLWQPYVSIKFGMWYISEQLALFNGHQFAALAAYNAGPGRVEEWIKDKDDLDMFVEDIAFQESRMYIRTIYINLEAYRRLYGK